MAKSPISQDWQGVSGIFTRHSDVVVCRLPGHPRVLITRGHRIFDGRGIGHGKISHRIASVSFQMQFCIRDSWQVKKSLRIKIRAIFWHIAFSARDAASDIAQNGPQTAQGASKRPWPVRVTDTALSALRTHPHAISPTEPPASSGPRYR